MNSLQKQTETRGETPEAFVVSFEKNLSTLSSVEEAETLMKKLQFLGQHYDPFDQEINSECRQVINNLGLTLHLQNPYLATNILLRLMDKTEGHLNKLKQ